MYINIYKYVCRSREAVSLSFLAKLLNPEVAGKVWELVRRNLDWVAANHSSETCDLWEEVRSSDFFWNRYTMRKARFQAVSLRTLKPTEPTQPHTASHSKVCSGNESQFARPSFWAPSLRLRRGRMRRGRPSTRRRPRRSSSSWVITWMPAATSSSPLIGARTRP